MVSLGWSIDGVVQNLDYMMAKILSNFAIHTYSKLHKPVFWVSSMTTLTTSTRRQ